MKNRIYFLALFLPFFLSAQDWGNLYKLGGNGIDNLQETFIDQTNGDIYITGSFTGKLIFSGTSEKIELSSLGNEDIFIAKFTKEHNVVWASSFGGSLQDVGRSISVDGMGNVLVTGFFWSNQITFGEKTITNKGQRDIFLLKLNKDGVLNWANSYGNNTEDGGSRVVGDDYGNIYLAGFFSKSINFQNDIVLNSNSNSNDLLLVKFSSMGNCIWARRAGGIHDGDSGYDLRVSNGSCFVAGYMTGAITVGGSAINNTLPTINSYGGFDILLISYDLVTGTENWVRSAGSPFNESAFALEVTSTGYPVISGTIGGNAVFNNTTINSAGGSDVFVAQYSKEGNLQWVRRAGGSGNDASFDIDIDNCTNNIYVSGSYSAGNPTFGTKTLTNSGGTDFFVSVYDISGTFQWVRNGGGNGNEQSLVTIYEESNLLVISGQFNSVAMTLDENTVHTIPSTIQDIFLASLSIYSSFEIYASRNTVCPTESNPTISLFASIPGLIYAWSPSDWLSSTTNQNVIFNGDNAEYGNHIIRVTGTNGCITLSNSINILVSCPLSNGLGVGQNYPNPVFSAASIPYWTNGSISTFAIKFYRFNNGLVLYKSIGVQQGGTQSMPRVTQVDMSSWPSGTYYYRIESSEESSTYKSLSKQ